MNLFALSRSPYFWSLQDDAFLFARHSPIEDFSDQRLPATVAEVQLGLFDGIGPADTGDGVVTPHVFTLLGMTWLNHVESDGVVETPAGNLFGI